jgi:hypothetical protein
VSQKKSTGRARKRDAYSNSIHEHTPEAARKIIEKQEHDRDVKYNKEQKHQNHEIQPTANHNTKKPKNLDYKHQSNVHREEIQIVNDMTDEWIVVDKRGKKRVESNVQH